MDGRSQAACAPDVASTTGVLVDDVKAFLTAAHRRAEELETELLTLRTRKSLAEAALLHAAAVHEELGARWVAAHREAEARRAAALAEAARIRQGAAHADACSTPEAFAASEP